jgi:hypothetical protein
MGFNNVNIEKIAKKINLFESVIFIYFKKKKELKIQKYNYVFKIQILFFFTKNINMFHFTDNIIALLFTNLFSSHFLARSNTYLDKLYTLSNFPQFSFFLSLPR